MFLKEIQSISYYTTSTAQGCGRSFIVNLWESLVGVNHGWRSESTHGPKGGWGARSPPPLLYLSIYLPIYLSFYSSIYLPIYPSVCLSIHLYVYRSFHPSIHPLTCKQEFYPCANFCYRMGGTPCPRWGLIFSNKRNHFVTKFSLWTIPFCKRYVFCWAYHFVRGNICYKMTSDQSFYNSVLGQFQSVPKTDMKS